MDYKDIWSEAYYNAKEEGKSTEEAEKFADERTADHFASLADLAKDEWKYRDV
jgi:hypothetical protein